MIEIEIGIAQDCFRAVEITEEELIRCMTEEITKEIDREIMKELMRGSTWR